MTTVPQITTIVKFGKDGKEVSRETVPTRAEKKEESK